MGMVDERGSSRHERLLACQPYKQCAERDNQRDSQKPYRSASRMAWGVRETGVVAELRILHAIAERPQIWCRDKNKLATRSAAREQRVSAR